MSFFRSLRLNSLLAATLCTLLVPIGHAKEPTPSESSVMMTGMISVMLVAMPFMIFREATRESGENSAASSPSSHGTPQCEKPCCGTLADMEVTQVGHNDQGQRQVVFAATDNPQQRLAMIWTVHAGASDKHKAIDPAAGFVVGQHIRFQPNEHLSGCVVKSTSGQTLAFVPSQHIKQADYSESF